MNIYLTSPLLQAATVFFLIVFAYYSYKKPAAAIKLFPIILPIYLVKVYFKPLSLISGIKDLFSSSDFFGNTYSLLSNSFFDPPYINTPVFPPDFLHNTEPILPSNILELSIIVFLIINFKLIVKGVRTIQRMTYGKWLLISILLLLTSTITSTWLGINIQASLGVTKSWFIIPILLFFAHMPYFLNVNFRKKYLYYLAVGGIVTSLLSLPFLLDRILTYDQRLSAIYLSPNHLSMALAPGMIALFILLSGIVRKKSFFQTSSILFTALLLLELIILYFTYSYGSWVAIACAILFITLLNARRPARSKGIFVKHLSLIALLSILSVSLLYYSQHDNPKLASITKGEYYSSFHSRQLIWTSSVYILKDYWLQGIGGGNFQKAYLDYSSHFNEPYLEWAVPQPHNVFLAFAVQLGILGLISFVLIMVFSIWRILKIIRANNHLSDILIIFAISYGIYFFIHGLIDTPYWKNDLSVMFWIALACIWSKSFGKNV